MLTFIIVIVVFVLIKFIYDTSKQSSSIRRQGGIRTKYSTLINHILESDKRSRILQEDDTFVSAGIVGPAGSQVYNIYPTYGNVTIEMEIKNNPLLGNIKMEWTFPDNMDQNDMIRNINKDLEEKFSNLYNQFK